MNWGGPRSSRSKNKELIGVRRSSRTRNYTYNSLEENRLTAPYSMGDIEVEEKRIMRSSGHSSFRGDQQMPDRRRHSDNLDPDENASPSTTIYDGVKSRTRGATRGSSQPIISLDVIDDRHRINHKRNTRRSNKQKTDEDDDEDVEMEDDAIKKKKPDRNLRPRRHQQREINSAEEPESGEGDDDLDENVDIKQRMPDRNLRPRRNQQNVINSAEEPESGEGDEEEGDEEESDDDIDIDEEVDIKQEEEDTACEGEEERGYRRGGYTLRQKCPQTNRYADSIGRRRGQVSSQSLHRQPGPESEEDLTQRQRPKRKCVLRLQTQSYKFNTPRLPRNVALERKSNNRPSLGLCFSQRGGQTGHRRRNRFYDSSSSTTSTTSNEDQRERTTAIKDLQQEAKFERRKLKSMIKGRQHLMPMNMTDKDMNDVALSIRDRNRNAGSSCADIDPMTLDRDIGFEHVGGLTTHIQSLKEIIQLPMLYPEMYKKFDVDPPKGVLFYGPPGTGKTLMARALANVCSRGNKKVAFFMRKGADCLSKWVGESERQLRLLFDQAYKMRPSIIFFDEIDGLAPVRSSRQDQIHSSIVSTLLALMDGLDKREQIVIIGATNRLDAIDPALRRPGRFDRELRFDLPDVTARRSIIEINTQKWGDSQPSEEVFKWLAENTPGYCGADLKALCTEAVMVAMRKLFPHMYISKEKLLLDPSKVTIEKSHFADAMNKIVPAARRDFSVSSHPIKDRTECFVASLIDRIMTDKVPEGYKKLQNVDNLWNSDLEKVVMALKTPPSVPAARIFIHGNGALGQTTHILPVIVNRLDHLPVFTLSCEKIFSGGVATPEENVSQTVRNALRATSQGSPVVFLMPDIHILEFTLNPSVWKMLVSVLGSFTGFTSIFLLASTQQHYSNCSDDIKQLFRFQNTIELTPPDAAQRNEYFEKLLMTGALDSQPTEFNPADYPEPPKAVEVENQTDQPKHRYTLTEYKEHKKLYEQMLRQLRIFLRDLLGRLTRDRRFNVFNNPVDKEDAPDYYEIIQSPMCLANMMTKIDNNEYNSVLEFVNDVKLIRNNAVEYNPNNEGGRNIRHAASALIDMTDALLDLEMDDDFPEKLEDQRKRVEESSQCVQAVDDKNPEKMQTEETQQPNTSQNLTVDKSIAADGLNITDNGAANSVPLNGSISVHAKGTSAYKRHNPDCCEENSDASKSPETAEPVSKKAKITELDSLVFDKEYQIEIQEKQINGGSEINSDAERLVESQDHTTLSEPSEIVVPQKTIIGLSLDDIQQLVRKIVQKTVDWSIPDLECLGAELDQHMQKYRQKWDRNELLSELDHCAETFQL